MKDNYKLVFFVFLSFVLFLLLFFYFNYFDNNVVFEDLDSKFKFYFCSSVDCNNVIVNNLYDSYNVSCAFYNVKDEDVLRLLREKNSFVVSNSKNVFLEEYNIPFVFRKSFYSRGLMHDKFCVFKINDTNNSVVKSIFTGSFNPTSNNTYDLLFFVNSSFLYENYFDEFFELKNKIFSSGDKVKYNKIESNCFYLYNFFCPEDSCKSNILDFVSKSKSNISILVFSFTDDDFFNLLYYKSKNNVSVNVFVDSKSLNFLGSDIFRLKAFSNVFVENSSKLLHHKVILIDDDIIIFGSPNFSFNGFFYNDENVIVLERKNNSSCFDNILKQFYNEINLIKNNSYILE